MFALFVLLCLNMLVYNVSSVKFTLPRDTTLDRFIAETRRTLYILQRNINGRQSQFSSKRYNIVDTLSAKQQQINLIGLCIKTSNLIHYLEIVACDPTTIFSVSVHYANDHGPIPHAFISDIDAAAGTNHKLSGTEIMLLLRHILVGIGVKSCGLQNSASIRYDYHSDRNSTTFTGFIPLIYLRCIKGKTSDWYSDFGFYNANKDRITAEMLQIYGATDYIQNNSSTHSVSTGKNMTFGSWLYALWNRPNKREFHVAYQDNLWRFKRLKWLRDVWQGKWTAHFE